MTIFRPCPPSIWHLTVSAYFATVIRNGSVLIMADERCYPRIGCLSSWWVTANITSGNSHRMGSDALGVAMVFLAQGGVVVPTVSDDRCVCHVGME